MEKIKLLNELYNLTDEKNIADLISDFEFNQKFNMELKYKNIYKKNDDYIIEVFDSMSESNFELIYNKDDNSLEVYYEN